MVHEIKRSNLFNKITVFSRTPFFIPILFLLFLVLTIPVITLVTQRSTDFEQRAATFREVAMSNFESTTGASYENNSGSNFMLDNLGPLSSESASSLALFATVTTIIIAVIVMGTAWYWNRKSPSL